MKNYYKMESSNYVDYGITKSPKMGDASIMRGRIVDPKTLPPLVFEHNFPKGEPIPHYLTGGTVLASNHLIALLTKLGVDNFQAFPATLINPETQEQRTDYCLFNVIGFLRAANMELSNYDEIMKGNVDGIDMPLVAFKNLTLDSKKVRDLDLFRLAEEPISVVISDVIVEGLKNNKPADSWGIILEDIDMV